MIIHLMMQHIGKIWHNTVDMQLILLVWSLHQNTVEQIGTGTFEGNDF